MNKSWMIADSKDHCYGICNHCIEDCDLNESDNDD